MGGDARIDLLLFDYLNLGAIVNIHGLYLFFFGSFCSSLLPVRSWVWVTNNLFLAYQAGFENGH